MVINQENFVFKGSTKGVGVSALAEFVKRGTLWQVIKGQ